MKRVRSFYLPYTPLARWILVWCWLAPLGALGQTPQWAWGQTLYTDIQALSGHDLVTDMQSDAAGNVYVVGAFTDDARFGTHSLLGMGGQDVFVAKFSPAGQCLWAISGGGPLDDGAPQLRLDSRGDLYVAVGSVSDFHTDCGVIPAPNSLHTAALLWKISAGGACQWVRVLAHSLVAPQSSGYIRIQSMDIDAADGPVCALESSGPVRIDTTDYPVQGLYTWLVRCDSGGRVRWTKEFRNSNAIAAYAVASTTTGQLFVLGSGINAQLGSITLPGSKGFVAMIDTSGIWQWAKQFSAGFIGTPRIGTYGNQVYMSGMIAKVSAFVYDGQPLLPSPGRGGAGADGWLVGLDATTGAPLLSYRTRAAVNGGCELNAIAIETGGAVYLTGAISGTVELRPGHPQTSLGVRDGFVVKLDSAGQPVWELTAGVPAPGFQVPTGIRPQAIAVAGPAGPVIGGVLADSVTLGGTTLTSNPRQTFDLFLAGIAQPLGLAPGAGAAGALQLWPNPACQTASLRWAPQPVSATLTVRDALGRVVRQLAVPAHTAQATLACAGLPAGLYGLHLRAGTYEQRTRLVVAAAE